MQSGCRSSTGVGSEGLELEGPGVLLGLVPC